MGCQYIWKIKDNWNFFKIYYPELAYKLVSAFEADGMSIAVVSLYALVELISWYERHDLSEYGLSLIHEFCLLQYDLQKYKTKSRKNNIRVTH